MSQKLRTQNVTEGVIWKQILSFFFPILLGTFFQQLYNTVDTIVVGRFVGTQALAAVGAAAPLISLLNGFFIGVSSGATVLISQFFGANDRGGVFRSLHTGVAFSLLLGTTVTFLGIAAGPQILHWIRTPETCISDAVTYIRIYFLGAMGSMFYNMGSGILRAMGDSRRPTLFLIVTCFVNIFLDILFVVVFPMGIAGAAAATVLAQWISAFLVLRVLMQLPEDIALKLPQLRLEKHLLKRILYIGVPAGLQLITFDLSNLLIQSGINSFGSATVAAFTAFGRTDALTWMVSGAFGVSITTFVGQNYGAQKFDRIRKGVRICLIMSILLVGCFSALELLLRRPILGIFTTDPEVVRLGAYAMLFTVPFNVILMPMEIFGGAMRGTGYSLVPTAITMVCICVFRILWLLIVVSRFHALETFLLCYPISWLLTASVFLITYLRGNWLYRTRETSGNI